MSKNELTAEQMMAIAIAKAKEARKQVRNEAKLALLANENYIDYLALVEDESDQVKSLNAIIDNLNKMKPIVTTDGSKYGVNIFPVAEYIFGPVMSRVIGIITGSSAMFTDERQVEFKALTDVNHLAATKARDAIGSPAYYSKGVLANCVPGDGTDINTVITAICSTLNIDLAYADKVNQTTIAKWFDIAQAKADKQYAEFKKTEIVDSENKFVLED